MQEENRRASEASSDANQKSNTELLNEINSIIMNSSSVTVDVDTIHRNLAILDERDPIQINDNREEVWQRIKAYSQEYWAAEQADEHENTADKEVTVKMRRPRRKLLAAVYAVVGVLLVLIVGSYALGADPFQTVAKWTGDKLFVAHHPSGELELPDDTVSEYRSLREALDANGAEDAMCPSWVPEDYSIKSVDCIEIQRLSRCSALFYAERGELIIAVSKGYSEVVNSIETESNGYREFCVGKDTFYCSDNSGFIQANGEIGSFSYSIVGNLSEGELERIIQSLYK